MILDFIVYTSSCYTADLINRLLCENSKRYHYLFCYQETLSPALCVEQSNAHAALAFWWFAFVAQRQNVTLSMANVFMVIYWCLCYWVLWFTHRISDRLPLECSSSNKPGVTNWVCQPQERERHRQCIPLKEMLIKALLFVLVSPLKLAGIPAPHSPKPLL